MGLLSGYHLLGGAGGGSGSGGGGGGGDPVSATSETVKVRKYGNTFEVTGAQLDTQATFSAEHGLGRIPDGWEGHMECTTVDKNYAVGDRVQWKPPPWRQTVRFDATHTIVYTKTQGWGIIDKGSTTGGSTNIDLSDWKLVIRPYISEDKVVVTEVDGSIVDGGIFQIDDDKFFTTGEIANPALANNQSRAAAVVPNEAGTLTQRGTDLGFARAAASPYNLTYEPEADQPAVVGLMIRGKTGTVDAGVPVFLFFGNATDIGTATFAAADVKVADGRYLRVRADLRQAAGDTIDIRTYGGDTPVALAVTLEYFAITKVD